MGKMNLLKANWEGKVGETVGSKWKNRKTIRTFTKPSNPNTAAQQSVRGAFALLTSYVALFADGIKYKNALDTAGMSARNAIIKLNKAQIADGTFEVDDLIISKGGLQKPMGLARTGGSGAAVTVTWTAPTATNFTENAELVVVAVDSENQTVDVFSAKATDLTATGTVAFATGATVDVFAYYLDKRGSNKIASNSVLIPSA